MVLAPCSGRLVRRGWYAPCTGARASRPRMSPADTFFEGDFRQSVCYTWGMDGRLDGMILSNAQDRAVEELPSFPGYDDNGNVIGYWDEDGDLVAEYAYDAFGNTISATGSMADVFPHRFSTKYYDAETDLYYYGYRYYSPSLGRWISRDPIKE